MNYTYSINKYYQLKNHLNLVAGAILVFNFLNPQLAFAQTPIFIRGLEPTLKTNPASRLVRTARKPKKINAVITAYTSTPDQTDGNPFITASGKMVDEHTIAGNGLPFGTVIKIPSLFGEKRFIVTDRMNSRYNFGRFDVWLKSSQKEALKFGVKRVPVEIYYPDTELAIR